MSNTPRRKTVKTTARSAPKKASPRKRKPAKKKAAPRKRKPAKKKAAPRKRKPAKKKAAPRKRKPAKKKASPRKRKPAKKKAAAKKQPAKKTRRPDPPAPSPTSPAESDEYSRIKSRARARNLAASAEGRDIGELPAVENPQRKKQATASLRLFLEQYFPEEFPLAWSDDHLKVIAKIERAVLAGDLFAVAMPRGSGKTTICERAAIWAALVGVRRFVLLIGVNETHAVERLDTIKIELESNDLLLADWPEVCHPLRCLERITNRQRGQTYRGEPTYIGYYKKALVLPSIPGSQASAVILKVAGLTSGIRGTKHKRTDGTSARPDMILIDDPQTDSTAASPVQCDKRERLLAGAVLGLAGPGQKIAGVMPCTVIRRGDMADRILDRSKHPEWQGERFKLLYEWPANEKLWGEYAVIRREDLEAERGTKRCTSFYRKHRKAMDRGAMVAWPARKHDDELSALQHAMNLHLADPAAFASEYQNEPLPDEAEDVTMLTADEIAAKIGGLARGLVPLEATRLTAFIDVQQELLYWLLVAWADDFTGWVVDYGTWPEQPIRYFTLTDAPETLSRHCRGGLTARIRQGLEAATADVCGRAWNKQGGGAMRVERCLIDANWPKSTEVVYEFCRSSPLGAVLLPSHGRGITAKNKPLSQYQPRPGELGGLEWRISGATGKRAARHVLYDTNWWKSFIHDRLATEQGDAGSLVLYGARRQDGSPAAPREHRQLGEHLTAERPTRTSGRGRELDEWTLRPERPDNHWLDGLVGAAVAASIAGCTLREMGSRRRRRRISLRARFEAIREGGGERGAGGEGRGDAQAVDSTTEAPSRRKKRVSMRQRWEEKRGRGR